MDKMKELNKNAQIKLKNKYDYTKNFNEFINRLQGEFMNKLLPKKEELIPITNDRTTFYECGFNTDFDNLSFQKKLEIVNNLIRQTIIPTCRPNPNDHVESLIGNCHTAALAGKEYLKSGS